METADDETKWYRLHVTSTCQRTVVLSDDLLTGKFIIARMYAIYIYSKVIFCVASVPDIPCSGESDQYEVGSPSDLSLWRPSIRSKEQPPVSSICVLCPILLSLYPTLRALPRPLSLCLASSAPAPPDSNARDIGDYFDKRPLYLHITRSRCGETSAQPHKPCGPMVVTVTTFAK